MEKIISPLDNIIDIVNSIQKSNCNTRKGSTHDQSLGQILDSVNSAKNNLLYYLSELTSTREHNKIDNSIKPNSVSSYSSIVNNKTALKNNIIIPIDVNKKPDKSQIEKCESKIYTILKEQKSSATILKTTATDKGNYVINFKNGDNIDELKTTLSTEFGNNVKVIKPILPKIKIVGIPNHFNTDNKEEVIKSIIESNIDLANEYTKNNDCLQYLFSYKAGDNKSIVLKCSAVIRNILHESNDFIKINHKLCKLYNRYHILQCTKCCKLGHSSKNCKSDTIYCTFCAGNHSFQNCKVKDDVSKHRCHNCINKSHQQSSDSMLHNAFSKECPIKNASLNRLIARTDTGNSCL